MSDEGDLSEYAIWETGGDDESAGISVEDCFEDATMDEEVRDNFAKLRTKASLDLERKTP